ncbi:hypothetical protein CLOM_g21670 [Closterium sp. NIES-68]|nr:hypothetical protein CLOM_g21670 [Closterium sp. NIES-68]
MLACVLALASPHPTPRFLPPRLSSARPRHAHLPPIRREVRRITATATYPDSAVGPLCADASPPPRPRRIRHALLPVSSANGSRASASAAWRRQRLLLPARGARQHERGSERGERAVEPRGHVQQRVEGRRRLAGLWRGRRWRRPRRKAWERRLKQQKPWVRDARRYLHTGDSTGSSTLTTSLAYENLTRVNLNPFDKLHPRKGRRDVLLGCRGAPCPRMQRCHHGNALPPLSQGAVVRSCYDPGVGEEAARAVEAPVNCPRIRAAGGATRFDPACSHAEDDLAVGPWGSQVVVLENVWVNARGQAFNHHLYFDRGGCGSDHEFVHAAGTAVREYSAVVNLAHWNTWQFYHGLVELVPLFLALHALRHNIKGLPVALQLLQVEFFEQVGSFVLGLDAIDLNARVIPNDQLFFARRLYQPVYAWCGRPSPSLWHRLRHNHLLPPNGLPMLRPDWSVARRAPFSLSQAGASPPGDWVVVVARRVASRALEGHDALVQGVRAMVGGGQRGEEGENRERVVEFDGSLDISAARPIFRRTLLFIGVHGAALTNLIFMQPNATVVELRPRGMANACYHHLCGACGVQYYLVLCEGGKDTHTTCDMDQVIGAVEEAWRGVGDSFGL